MTAERAVQTDGTQKVTADGLGCSAKRYRNRTRVDTGRLV